jgi:hypothetical protein
VCLSKERSKAGVDVGGAMRGKRREGCPRNRHGSVVCQPRVRRCMEAEHSSSYKRTGRIPLKQDQTNSNADVGSERAQTRKCSDGETSGEAFRPSGKARRVLRDWSIPLSSAKSGPCQANGPLPGQAAVTSRPFTMKTIWVPFRISRHSKIMSVCTLQTYVKHQT